MPEMDGLEAITIIRKYNTSIPIIVQTAYAFSTAHKKCIDAGCSDYIIKPIITLFFCFSIS
jgi:CheY-like chemotaxis protein